LKKDRLPEGSILRAAPKAASADLDLGITNKLASYLASFGFAFFLAGRFTGAGLLRKYSAHSFWER
jgi:fucose permease